MAELGNVQEGSEHGALLTQGVPQHRRVIECGPTGFAQDVALDAGVGNPAPSLRVTRNAYALRLAVAEGERTVSVDVLQPDAAATRPKLRVRANAEIGLAMDLEAEAGAGTGWQTVSVSFTATANGGVRLELWNTDPAVPCWFDNVKVS